MAPDYSLYLVTDSTQAMLKGRDLVKVVSEAVKGGVTIVQYRDKTSDTRTLIKTAKRLLAVTKTAGIPLIINDRVDVALAVGADGAHIGQDDMDLATARKLLGPKAIIGVTCASINEADAAGKGGANYIGIGTLFQTDTKKDTESIIGVSGTREILGRISTAEYPKPATVAIGGLNKTNIQRVLYQTQTNDVKLGGVALVSAIMAAFDPKEEAAHLRNLVGTSPPFVTNPNGRNVLTPDDPRCLEKVMETVAAVTERQPLCHNMTNLVAQNFAANVALSVGGSPIMANDGGEAEDLAALGGSLVINMGTATPAVIENFVCAVRAYNTFGGPVLFDPVGAGATQIRREASATLMDAGYFDVIKGNEKEITTLLGESGVKQRGVDSGASTLSNPAKGALAKALAKRERNVVVMTGEVDFLSDGTRTLAVANGHGLLGQITASGCTLGTTIAACLAVEREDKLLAALAGCLVFEIAAEKAAQREDVLGPGTFIPAFLDSLRDIAAKSEAGDRSWIKDARVSVVNV